jgi:hypothetical protein
LIGYFLSVMILDKKEIRETCFLVKEIILNDTVIKVDSYEEELVHGLHKISVDFKVTSEEYHDVTTLLYLGTFDIKVPQSDLGFRGTIQEYSTSVTNLYEKGQTGNFKLSLLEMKEESKG